MSTPKGGGRKPRVCTKKEAPSLRKDPAGANCPGDLAATIPLAAPVPMALLRGRTIREVGDAFCRLLFYARDELVGRDARVVFPADDECSRVFSELDHMPAGSIATVETRFRRKDALVLDILLSAALAVPGDPSKGAILTAVDITARKRDEAALRQSEAKFRSLFLESKDAMVTVEPPDWRFTSCNPALLRVFGAKTEAEFTAHHPWTLSPERQPDGRPSMEKVHEVIDQVLREGSLQFEWTHRRLNGQEFPAEVLLTRVERGGDRFLVATIRDLSERKRAEEERRVIEGLLDLAPAAITIHYPGGQHLYANQRCLDMHGYSREEFMALNLRDLDVPESAALIDDRVRRLESGGELSFEVRHRRKDGSVFPLLVHARITRWGEREVVLSVAHDITALKRAEAALCESEHRLHDVAANIPGAVYQFIRRPDGSFHFPYMSEGASQLLGLPVAVLTDTAKLFSNVHPDDLPAMWESIAESARSVTRWKHEFRVIVGPGETKWIQGTSNPDRLDDGSIRWNGVLLDVTERKRAEDALRVSEQRLQQATEAARIGVWDWDIARNELVWDDSMYRLYGIRREDFSGAYEAWLRCVHPDDKETADSEVRAALRGEKEYASEFRVLLPDGSVRFVQVASQVLRDNDGRPLRMLGTNIDITERKKTEGLLQESELRFRSLSDASLEGILIHADGIVLDANAAFVRLLGYERPDELVGKNAIDLVVAPESRQSMRDRLRLREMAPTEITGIRKDGSRFAAEIHTRSVDYMGRDARIVCCRDITMRKRTENALRESESKLRSVFRAVPVGICIMKDRLFVSANEYWNREFGRAGGSIVGTSPRVLYQSEAEFERVGRELYGPLRERGLTLVETRLRRNDGMFRDVIMTAAPVSPDDPAAGAVVVVFDVTERKQAEAALRASESMLRSLLRTAPVGICFLKGRVILSANEYWFQGMGYAPEDVLGKSTRALYESDAEYERVGRVLYGHLRERGLTSTEVRLRRKDGTLRDIIVTVAPIHPEDPPAGTVAAFFDVTEHKRAEEARFEALARFEGFAEASQYGMGMADTEGRIVYVNPTLVRMLGERSAADCAGKHFYATYHSEATALKLREEAIPAILRDGQWNGEIELLTRDGRCLPVDANCFVIRDGNGAPRYMASILTDITERKRAEHELRTSEAQLSNALRMARAGHWEYDVATDTFTFNDHFYAIFGTTAEKAGGYRMSSADYAARFCHPDDVHIVRKEIEDSISTDDPYYSRQLEHRILYANGEVGYIVVRHFLVKDARGRTVKTYGVNQDITQRKRMEEALRQSEERFREMAELLPQTVFEMDASGRLTFVNQQSFSMYGRDPSDFDRGLYALDMIAPADRPRAAERIRALMGGDAPGAGDYMALRKDGTTFPVTVYAVPVRRDGVACGVRGIVVDVTDRKRAEEETARMQDQLRQAAKMEAIGRLAGGVAHDFNNLLTPILGYADVAMMQLGEKHSLYPEIAQIRRAAERAAALTRQLLTFSRRQVLQPRPLDLNAVLRDMDKMLRRLIGEDVRLNLLLGEGLHAVVADPGQMEQVVMNLAVNARDAMPAGGTLTVRTENALLDDLAAAQIEGASAGSYVLLSVSDTGTGMDKATLGRIFEPFFTTKAEGHGTGLGLATVYSIVQQSRGGLRVESEPGKGATFRVYFPAPACPVTIAPCPPPEPVGAGGHGVILVVEDAEMVRSMVRVFLAARGYTVLTAASADEALAVVRTHSGVIDLLLTDVILPGTDGPGVAAMVRKERPGIRVLFMSGYTDDAVEQRAVDGGGDRLIHKPFSAAELYEQVRRQLERPTGDARSAS